MEKQKKDNKEGNTMEKQKKDPKGDESMENNQKTTVTAEQKNDYQNCLKVFEQATKAWVEVAEAYIHLQKLPVELWAGDVVMKNEQRPNLGKFLERKFDITTGRLSQLSGAYKARQELKGIEGYETLSCNALYEMFRFVNSKLNVKRLTIKMVYEAVHTKGMVCEKTVKEWCRQFKNVTGSTKTEASITEQLKKIYQVAKDNLEKAQDEELKAITAMCSGILNKVREIVNARNNNAYVENGGEVKQEETERKQLANVA